MSRADVKKPAQPKRIKTPSIPAVLEILEQVWKQGSDPSKMSYDEPLDGLIETVLSQNTNDRNRDMAFDRLKSRGTWDEISALSQDEIIELIRPAGLCVSKAATIRRVLDEVKNKWGEYSLKAMKRGTREDAWNFMTKIQGVGPKTAACVLAFDLGFPAFPVDTHVARIAKRLGWAEANDTRVEIQESLENRVPKELKCAGHLNIIQHGKNICKAHGPKCGECPLRGICPSSNA